MIVKLFYFYIIICITCGINYVVKLRILNFASAGAIDNLILIEYPQVSCNNQIDNDNDNAKIGMNS